MPLSLRSDPPEAAPLLGARRSFKGLLRDPLRLDEGLPIVASPFLHCGRASLRSARAALRSLLTPRRAARFETCECGCRGVIDAALALGWGTRYSTLAPE